MSSKNEIIISYSHKNERGLIQLIRTGQYNSHIWVRKAEVAEQLLRLLLTFYLLVLD